MNIQFSSTGPAFPVPLVDALLRGEVVFLCGAGISAPQLPGFSSLVERCFEKLHMEMSPSERNSFGASRYEEVLGSLSRRIVNADDVTRAIVHLLKTPADPVLENHRTILRLSRDLENRPLIVTTNFDTLLEQALLEKDSKQTVQEFSSAGQDLPAPGSSAFRGIIHLHGRLADKNAGLLETPLIVTSADYGDAYMRSGWASRFLFDLCRCKTVVLIGYRAGDAPVRYFLNLLEADRQRFPELRRVYAFDMVSTGARVDAEVVWGALAVEPIAYEEEQDGLGNRQHTALWRDLAELADLIERPPHTRRTWARELLGSPYATADATETDRVAWLFRGTRDLWSEAINVIEDSAWLNFFHEQELWFADDAAWVIASWISKDFQSEVRLNAAIVWLERLGKPFSTQLDRELRRCKDLPDLWRRAWRLLTIAHTPAKIDWSEGSHMLEQSLKNPVLLHADLVKAVDMLTPKLEIQVRLSELYGRPPPERIENILDLLWPRLHLREMDGARSLCEALVAVPKPTMIMALASARLQDVVQLTLDMGMLEEDFDNNDYAVPSVEPHPQNEHHDGPVFLVELLAQLLQRTPEEDRVRVRAQAEVWRGIPGMLGARLWLHALRQGRLFTANEALDNLLKLERNAFWRIRRELALVLKDRAGEADAALVGLVERRILDEGSEFYSQYQVEEGQSDWRGVARDSAVWLRLNMLADAGRLTATGVDELQAIKHRHEHLDRDIEDQDYFATFSTSGVVEGDPSPILDADAKDRLKAAREALLSSDIEKLHGWTAYCRADPKGAFETLANAPLEEANAPLWDGLIGSLSFSEGTMDDARMVIVRGIFDALEPAPEPVLSVVGRRLSDLYSSIPSRDLAIAAWWPRLFALAEKDAQPLKSTRDPYMHAINSPGGRLTLAALRDIEASRNAHGVIDPRWIACLGIAAKAPGRQGLFARAVLIRYISFIVEIDANDVVDTLSNALGESSVEASALRSILVSDTAVSAPASRALHRHILKGALELGKERRGARAAAAKILHPALSIVQGKHDATHWGISLADTATCLREGPDSLRSGATHLLRDWIRQIDGDPALVWRESVRLLLDEVWPREKTLRSADQSIHFAELAIAAGEAFPEALAYLHPYMGAEVTATSIYEIEKSKAPEQFPLETLALLWRLFGASSKSLAYGIAPVLDRLVVAMPQIDYDRRLQSLNQRAMRLT